MYTVDPKNETAVREVVRKVLLMKDLPPHLPYEFTQKGMLERIGHYILYQDFCGGENLAINKKGKLLCTVKIRLCSKQKK